MGREEDARQALAEKRPTAPGSRAFCRFSRQFLESKPFVLNVYRSVSREQIERYLYRLTYDLLIGVVEEQAVGLNVRQKDKEFIAHFYKYGFVGLMLNWIRGEMKEDPEILIERLALLMQGSIASALNRFSLENPHQNP